jgi:hypothetical protein
MATSFDDIDQSTGSSPCTEAQLLVVQFGFQNPVVFFEGAPSLDQLEAVKAGRKEPSDASDTKCKACNIHEVTFAQSDDGLIVQKFVLARLREKKQFRPRASLPM